MQIRPRLLFVLFALALAVPMIAQDVARTVAEARKALDARQFTAASSLLETALANSSSIPESERRQALTVIHFFAGVAYAGSLDDVKAKQHIAAFLDLSPDARIDVTSKYDRHFVATFNEIAAARRETGMTFDQIYPGFAKFQTAAPALDANNVLLRDGTAIEILGTRAEKREWSEVMADAERTAYIESFWKKRDRTPATPENEFRQTFDARVAFADVAFTDAAVDAIKGIRGALSDRGKVFALLGAPAVVRRRPLTDRDRVVAINEFVNGTIEMWGYQREQLPISIPKPFVQYRFVSQKGVGDYALQKEEAFAIQALQSAGLPKVD